jgi:hypothetical protein
MNGIRTVRVLIAVCAGTAPIASVAATPQWDDQIAQGNHVAAMSRSYHPTARISGLLEFCGQDKLMDAVDQKMLGDVMIDRKTDTDVVADVVQVTQSLHSYSSGVAMGLKLAVVPTEKKKVICAQTLELATKYLTQPHSASDP